MLTGWEARGTKGAGIWPAACRPGFIPDIIEGGNVSGVKPDLPGRNAGISA